MDERMGSALRSTGRRTSWRWQVAGAVVSVLGLALGYAVTVSNASNSFAAAADHFVVVAPASTQPGTPFTFTVTAKDSTNATDPTYTGTVHFTSSDGAAVLPADYPFVAGDLGVHTFTATATTTVLNTNGVQTITATDTGAPSKTGVSNNIAVSNATHFGVVAPATATAGQPFTFTVTALTAVPATATTYGGTVHFTSTDAAKVLPSDYTFVPGDNGVHTFTTAATLNTIGSQTITATDTVSPPVIAGTSNAVNVVAVHFSVTAPTTTTPGSALTFTVTALNFDGTTHTSYAGTVHFTSSDPLATLPADSTLTNGVGSFAATLSTDGAQTIVATDTVVSAVTGSTAVTVAAAVVPVTPVTPAVVPAAVVAPAAVEPRFTG